MDYVLNSNKKPSTLHNNADHWNAQKDENSSGTFMRSIMIRHRFEKFKNQIEDSSRGSSQIIATHIWRTFEQVKIINRVSGRM